MDDKNKSKATVIEETTGKATLLEETTGKATLLEETTGKITVLEEGKKNGTVHRNKYYCPECGNKYSSESVNFCPKCRHPREVKKTW